MIIAVSLIVVLTVANLRGTRESGRVFAISTYAFVGLTLLLFVWAGIQALTGGLPEATTAATPLPDPGELSSLALLVLVVRAFASGCTALTGVDAISNGVPSFQRPKARNAAMTLTMMGVIAVVLFGGITVLAVALHAQAMPDGNPSVISQIAAAVFGGSSVVFYLFQAATAAILILAANTAFNGFPGLASILARDSYLPRQLHNRGDRLVFSNGVVLLAGAAAALIIGFDANIDRLIQLYIVGVFTSFTLSQFGMVKHWQTLLRRHGTTPDERPRGDTDRRGGWREEPTLDAPGAGHQRRRRGVHRGRAGRGVRHQGRPRRLDRRRRDDRAVHRHAVDQPVLHQGHRRGGRRRRRTADPAQPGACAGAGVPAAPAGHARAGAGPRHATGRHLRRHPGGGPRRDQAAQRGMAEPGDPGATHHARGAVP